MKIKPTAINTIHAACLVYPSYKMPCQVHGYLRKTNKPTHLYTRLGQ